MKTILLILLTSTAFSQTIKTEYGFTKVLIRVNKKYQSMDTTFNVMLPKHPVTTVKYKAYDVMILDKDGKIIATKVNGKKWKIATGHTSAEALDAVILSLFYYYKKD
jgi:predicted fused transcriptional regulator/phosphomethylpyrimidine kinase